MRDANSPIVRQPKMIEIAAKINDSTPSAILPFVAIKTLSLLKNIPEPIQIPTIIVMAVNNPYFFVTSLLLLFILNLL